MAEYEELVKLLRSQVDANNEEKCDLCPYEEDYPPCVSCMNFTLWRAANAIEEQSIVLESYRNRMRAGNDWIPVTERPPETRSSILGQKSSKVIVAFQFDDETQGTDTAHTLNGNWVFEDRITVVNRTVTHWMPLPEPPKEEHDGWEV